MAFRFPVGLALWAASLALAPVSADAACNLIPPAEQAFPSTVGSITSPITTVGHPVEIRLAACDGSAGFDPTPANNQVTIAFVPGGPTQNVPSGDITVTDCDPGPSPPCQTLSFTMPSTPNLAGPAQITITVGATVVADIGPLFQAHQVGSTCDKTPETVFQQFTVLPPPNVFGDVVSGGVSQVQLTLDGSGSIVIPFDYRTVLPLGPGAPVARLLSGASSIDAFPGMPGTQPIDVPTSYVRSFTIDGRPLPPLLRATDAGNQVFGATDGAVAIIRVARTGSEGVKFDLASLRTNGGYGPIVVPSAEYTVATGAAIPLENLHSTDAGVSFARDEQIENSNLNGSSGDTDKADHVVQLIEVGTFASTNTGMAASATHNPIVGGAALDVSPQLAAFFESEASQNNADLNGDGDTLDNVLRVFTVGGTQLTPSATLVGNPFPSVNHKPLAISGSLVYYRETQAGLVGAPATSSGAGDIVVSPDGRYLYGVSASVIAGFLGTFHLDPETGGQQRDHTTTFVQGGLQGATGVAVSPDSRFIFVAVKDSAILEAIEVVYDPIGTVDIVRYLANVAQQGVGGVDGLTGVTHVAVSPDGKHAYTVADGDDAIAVFAVDPSHGALSFVQAIKNGIGVADMADPGRVVVSSDGKHVYVAAHGSSALQVFSRNTTTGVLTPTQTLLDGGTGGASLGGITDVAVSPDGQNVYATSDTDSALTIFSRNPATGALTFIQAITNGVGGVTDLDGGKSVVVSPDNTAVYASTAFGHLLVFTRTMPGGALTYVQSLGLNFGAPLDTSHLAVSPDSEHVYQAFDEGSGVESYARRGTLRAFDSIGGALKPGLDGTLDATLVAASGKWAAFTSSNGGGDARLYDGESDTVTTIGGGIKAAKVAISSQLIAMMAPEGALGVDGNKDGDQNDVVLVVEPTATPTAPPKIVPIEAENIGVTDLCLEGTNDGKPCVTDADCGGGTCRGLVVVATNEFAYKDNGENPNPPSADFNHNGVVNSALVLFVYDSATRKLTNVGWQAFDFVVGGHLVAFRTDENEIARDLNGNGLVEDTAMLVYDLATKSIVNPAKAVVKCELPGCEPGLPYKIKGESVVFLTPEPRQGSDLDGDGLETHTVVVVYDTSRATTQSLGAVDAAGSLPAASTPPGGTPPLLPTTFANASIIYKQVKESDVGKDLNGDLDLDDVVTLVEGDSDGDGVFDNEDVCTETPNADQRDTDEDGLPDACDPNAYCGVIIPSAPPVPPDAVEPCQKAIGKVIRKVFAAQAKATRACLDKVAAGKLVGEPTFLCRGGVADGVAVLPGDTRTALKVSKAVAKVASTATAKCSINDLLQLQACATDPSNLAACASMEAAEAVSLLSDLAYGNVGPIVDPTTRRCQKAIGKATTSYLSAITKAMGTCLDKLNAGKLSGSGDTLCLGAGTGSGITLPSDPNTATKMQRAADSVLKRLTTACPGSTATGLNACGTDATSLAECIRCAHGRRAIGAIRAAYGPQ